MRVRVRLFASYREALGREWLEEDLPTGARVRDLLQRLASRHGLATAPGRALVARRMEYVAAEAPLADGDEIALLPPLSGGCGGAGMGANGGKKYLGSGIMMPDPDGMGTEQ